MPDPRRPLISGNWKMNLNHFEAIQAVQKLHWLLPKDVYDSVDVSVHAPFTDIRSVQTVIQGDSMEFLLGAQHCHQDDSGAFTGEVSPAFLAKLDVKMVICGHSERRSIFGETEIRVLSQVSAGLEGVKAEQAASMVIAYEPVWAIGTGRTATAADAQAVCSAIRSAVTARFDAATGSSIRIQYGGSVKAGTTEELMACADVDGALVGGASLDPDEFAQIVRLAAS